MNSSVPDYHIPDTTENRMNEYNLLETQIADGKYDPNGPADVAPTNQNK